jgi:hypothetical protein
MTLIPSTHISLDAEGFEEVCSQVAKPMKKAVRKTVEEAVFLVSFFIPSLFMFALIASISYYRNRKHFKS